MMEFNIAKVLLETVLENNDATASPIRFIPETKTWIFYDETWTMKSQEYETLDEALVGFKQYCEKHIEKEFLIRGITA